MPTAADIKQYKAANHPLNDSGVVGGAITGVEITGTLLGEVFPSGTIVADPSGGSDQLFYYKSFVKNTHGTDSLSTVTAWLKNALDQLSASSVIRLQSTSASDGGTKKVRLYGKVGGVIATEDVTLNGTTAVTSTSTFQEIYRAVIMLVADSSVTTSVGDIQTRRHADGVLLGIIPAGKSWATAEVDFGFATAQNDSGTSTNRKTAPGGITFSRPNTSGEATAMTGTNLAAGNAIGVWWRMTVKAGMVAPPVIGVQVLLTVKGNG